ncbi:MAG: hypothetical protein C0459_01060 [Chitinophaga sp.]|jgi:hypothetical protein|nr:hypothetical protein [Chitinophaga sp.]
MEEFLNLKEFIIKEFFERELIIKVQSDFSFTNDIEITTRRWCVIINNSDIISWNFRMLYTTFPELLLLICYTAKSKRKLKPVLKEISNLNLFNSSRTHFQSILKTNFERFFQAIFFSDLYSDVWNGNEKKERVFALKVNDELIYLSIFQKFLISTVFIKNCLC